MTLYLKYRPQKISELDLKEVRESLEQVVKNKDLPHAWLFSGPRGTGKTSAARILAKYINCTDKKDKPCNECEMCESITVGSCPDVIEVDAASNRGIDDIRELRERIGLAPMQAKFKVYIIDEVHMLTTEAANALLKTLEEPPAHAVFVLCTTEPDKLPETVVSRCSRVLFKKPSLDEIVDRLNRVALAEGQKIGKADLEAVARAAKGSFRDGIKILEQVIMNGGKVAEVLGSLGTEDAELFLKKVREGDSRQALDIVEKLAQRGTNFRNFTERCVELLREEMLGSLDKGLIGLIEGLEKAYVRMKDTAIVQLPLEIFVIETVGVSPSSKSQTQIPNEATMTKSQEEPKAEAKVLAGESRLSDVVGKWAEVMKAVRPKNHSVEALLRSTKPADFDGRDLVLEAFYEFHKKQLETDKCRKIVESAVAEVMGVEGVVLKLKMGEGAKKHVEPNITKVEDDELIAAAQEIFK